ncbi:MAG: glycosyltransferase family 9 protein [Verrucomicrobia bacterium]|nr:glycosyltransferase family 9 protein [Verrucomicrobiota bacterium]
MKPRLLVLEFWGLGDLVIATPFLRAASEKFSVTLVAKPFAEELRPRLWPGIKVEPFIAPWTAFHGKYQVWRWPLREMLRLRQRLAAEKFDYAVSARWDPRDHFAMKFSGAVERLGFSRLKSRRYLTRELIRPDALAHRYEFWREAGHALGLDLPVREELVPLPRQHQSAALIHSGARLPARIWPLENFRQIAARLRKKNINVQIACDPDQHAWWQAQGEQPVCPRSVAELLGHIDRAGAFIGNCSGPGHLAAICGVPTFTLYGPSLHEWFAPLHPAAEIYTGRACPYKPCSDYCRYAQPFCLHDITAEEVWPRVETFTRKHLADPAGRTGTGPGYKIP